MKLKLIVLPMTYICTQDFTCKINIKDMLFQGILSQEFKNYTVTLDNFIREKEQTLRIIVDNEGHQMFINGTIAQKGIISGVIINGKPLYNWTMTPISFDTMGNILTLSYKKIRERIRLSRPFMGIPKFYYTEFPVQGPLNTYLDTTGWGKGIVWINGHNIGRFWALRGPQMGLYIPYVYLLPHSNILILELERPRNDLTIRFTNSPWARQD